MSPGPTVTMSIRINATVQEARTAANHSQEQWDRFYVSMLWSQAPAWLILPVHNQRRGQAACRGASRLEKMDPHPRQRKGTNARPNKCSTTSRRYSARRDDYPQVARLPAAAGHPTQVRYVFDHICPFVSVAWRAGRPAPSKPTVADPHDCAEAGSMLQGIPGTGTGSGSASPIQVQTSQALSDSGLQSPSSQRTEYSPSETRPYDPIRDV